MHAQKECTHEWTLGGKRFSALPSVALIYCRSSGTHNGLSSSLRVPGLIEKANEINPHYVFQIKDRAFSEAKHSATRSLNLKRDKYYKHRLYLMCVVKIVITFDLKTGYIEKRSRYVTLPW